MESQFDTAVAAYERSMEEMPFREHVEAWSFLNAVGDVTGRSVLDLGCGSGLYARRLRREGAARVVGMDESAAMVEHARRREEREGLGVEYVAADAADPAAGDLPDIARSFDVETAVYVLPYASSPQALKGFCATARRVLRATGGRFVAAVYRGYGMLLSSQKSPAEGTPGHLRAWAAPRPATARAELLSGAAVFNAFTHRSPAGDDTHPLGRESSDHPLYSAGGFTGPPRTHGSVDAIVRRRQPGAGPTPGRAGSEKTTLCHGPLSSSG
ncbi:class I SAM-dependent methyltransferase [Streptomyces sp. NPDC054874]